MENDKIEVLKTAEEYIYSLKNGIMQAVNCFQIGEESKGSNLIVQICDGIEWLVKALTLCKDVIDSENNINNLNEKLGEIVEAFQNEDYILIGDLMEYEVVPILDTIQADISAEQVN